MKDFNKTNEFVRASKAFSDLLIEFWHDLNGSKRMPVDSTLERLRDLKNRTRFKGEELAEEVKEICPDLKELQRYFDLWTARLDLIDTGFISFGENISSAEWASNFDDDQKGLSVYDIVSAMCRNYEDVISGRNWLAETYDLIPGDHQSTDDHQNAGETSEGHTVQSRHKEGDFLGLIQYHDKEKLLNRLHELIDGKSGADVGSVIRKAIDDGYLMNEPTKADYESEFELIGTWQAIHNYFHFELDNGKLVRSERIVIF